ncbi:MAG: hypothetical protein EBQ96_00940 [Proteobacteria bacterium]|nr:hypothetical protein [Pseudomonadota bacterium]
MAKNLTFSVFLAILILGAFPVQAQQSGNYQYGGSTDPLGTGNDLIGVDPALAKPKRPSSGPVFLSGTGPINLRAGAYVSHEPVPQQDPALQQPAQPKPNSAIIYNETLQQKKEADTLNSGWDSNPFQ